MGPAGPRYRFVLLEEPECGALTRFRRPRPFFPLWVRRHDPLQVLVEALMKLSFRSEGERAWAPALSEDPLAFLLDAVGDAVAVHGEGGGLLYANPAGRRMADVLSGRPMVELERLVVGGRSYERRCMVFGRGRARLVLQVLRRIDE